MAAEYAADWVSELEQEFDDELPRDLHPESEFDLEGGPYLRPWIRSTCGEARNIRSHLLTARGALRSGAILYARKWLIRNAERWYKLLPKCDPPLTRQELDILAGCLYGVASAIREEPEPYRRLRSAIGERLGIPAAEFDGEVTLKKLPGPGRDSSADPEIFPPDGRRLVTNTLLVPFRFVCCLEITFVNPLNNSHMVFERGTGTLISDRHVLTAAHVVFENISRRVAQFPVRYIRAQTILVAPARNDRGLPFGFSDVTNVRVAPGWQAAATRTAASGAHVNGDPQGDFALLTLATPLGRQEPLRPTMQLPPPLLGFWGSRD